MSDNNGDKDSRALAPFLPIGIQTRAAAVDSQQASLMLPTFKAMWPKEYESSPAAMLALAKVSIAYGLDPLMGEIIVLGGKLYVTFEGRLRKAMDHEQYAGLECRPATEEERAAFRAAETDHVWRAEIYRRDWQKPVVGWGRVTLTDSNPVARQWPQAQAEKRAKARALRDAFSIPLPNAEEAAEYEGSPQRYIDGETGEITDTRRGGMLAMQGHLAAIHILSQHLGIEDAERHEQLHQMFGKNATNELTEGEAAAYLEFLGNMQAEREAKNPLVIEGKQRDAAMTQVPRETAQKFEARPDWPPPRGYEDVFGETEPTGDTQEEETQAEPVPAEPVTEPEVESLGTAMPGSVAAALRRASKALITGEPFPFQDDPKRKGVQAKGASDRLKLFEFSLEEIGAAYVLAHFHETGKLLDSQEAYKKIDARYFTGLQVCESAIIEGLHEAARWWLGSQEVADHA